MVDLTVGYVSGFIALAIAIFSFLLPNLIALLMASVVGRERSAVTWSVLGRQLHKCFWPTLLNADTASGDLPRPIWLLTWLETICIVLVTVAGVVTPLGLRSEIILDHSPESVAFHYLADSGPMGYGTPPRDPHSFLSRICPNGCPFSNTVVVTTRNSTVISYHWDDSYDLRLPYVTADVFSSVHDDHSTTVAGALEMEWRQFAYSLKVDYNDNKTFPVGMSRRLTSLILDDNVQAVEGLVVDTITGGLALRNHTVPAGLKYGAEWTEELLFLSPDSVCVDTNLTLDFEVAQIGTYQNGSHGTLVNTSITDRGGFVNLNTTPPEFSSYEGQTNPDLWHRAYKGAWWNNALSMLYFNATNPKDKQHPHAFQYLNSSMNKTFWLNPGDAPVAAVDKLTISNNYGGFIQSTGYYSASNNTFVAYNYSKAYADQRSVYPNPFHVASSNFSLAKDFCVGTDMRALANISNLAVSCGLLYGAATRQDGRQSLVLEPGSKWTQPIYSCATAAKAEMKQVHFQWNSTADGGSLQRLKIRNVTTMTYTSDAQRPWWAVENLHSRLDVVSPLWGPVSAAMAKRYAQDINFNFVQSDRLYIPGTADYGITPGLDLARSDNLAAPRAIQDALYEAYSIDSDSQYNGQLSMAILAKWQRLSGAPITAAQIPNLIFTDALANSVLGSRSWLSSQRMPYNIQPVKSKSDSSGILPRQQTDANSNIDAAQTTIPSVPIYVYKSRITYNWLFSIPAFLVLALFGLIFTVTFVLTVLGRVTGPSAISNYLKYTSAGRLLAVIDDQRRRVTSPQPSSSWLRLETSYAGASGDGSPEKSTGRDRDDGMNVSLRQSTKQWVKGSGQRVLNLDAIAAQQSTQEPTDRLNGTTGDDSENVGLAVTFQSPEVQDSGGYKPVPQVAVEPYR